jgi:hypothetical protein
LAVAVIMVVVVAATTASRALRPAARQRVPNCQWHAECGVDGVC